MYVKNINVAEIRLLNCIEYLENELEKEVFVMLKLISYAQWFFESELISVCSLNSCL